VDLSLRSYEPELLDGQDIPFEEIRSNMRELETINSLLGGHRITLKAFRRLAGRSRFLHVCEIGCGGGDNLKMIHRWCRKKGITLNVTGIDINANCIAYARENCAEITGARWIVSDYRTAELPDKPDIIFNSLFCHHFSDDGVAEIFLWMRRHARIGSFINDLHRHALAYHSIHWLTALFSRSRLVRHDAPLSVRRGFRKEELKRMMDKSLDGHAMKPYALEWQWAFRWMLVSPASEIIHP
jgi:2-polyprenyl-3-methyl-5-hydroxy-6-metoxy-1,4-benzoquinol methylase